MMSYNAVPLTLFSHSNSVYFTLLKFCNRLTALHMDLLHQLLAILFSNKMSEKIWLKWKDFKENIKSAFGNLREENNFSDVTLVCEDGQKVEAHKVILAASSPFFQMLLETVKHTTYLLIFMRKVKYEDLMAIIDFIYVGEASVLQENLDSFLATADELQLKGLVGKVNVNVEEDKVDQKHIPPKLFKRVATFSNNLSCQASGDGEYISGAESAPVMHDFSGDQEDLDIKVKSMMQISQNLRPNGLQRSFLCKVCGKEGHGSTIKNHIEANHFEGIAIPCHHCSKTFRSKNS